MRINVPVDVVTPNITITLPANVPLMCDVNEAARLFGVSTGTLANLRRAYKDFPVKSVGRSVMYLVPDMYAWFRDFPAQKIATE